MSELPIKPVPHLCECILHESTAKIREQLNQVDSLLEASSSGGNPNTKKLTEAQKKLKEALNLQAQMIHAHVTEYRAKFTRNMVEYAKVRALNLGEPLQTNGHTLGDLKKIREPPKKKQKKDKKTNLDGGVALASSSSQVVVTKRE